MPYEPLDQIDGLRLYNRLVMLRPKALRDRARERPLVESVPILETDREGLDRLTHNVSHQCDDRARVDAPAEEGAKRHVGDQTAPDGLVEPDSHLAGRIVEAQVERLLGPVQPR